MVEITGKTWRGHTVYSADGVRLPGPSGLAGYAPKNLTGWYAEQCAEYAVNHWDRLSGLPSFDRVKQIQGAPGLAVSRAAERGTVRHDLMERLAGGESVSADGDWQDGKLAWVSGEARREEVAAAILDAEAAVTLIDRFGIEPAWAEIALANLNPDFYYAGTADLIAYSARLGGHVLLDHKFGKHIYASHAIQLSAYAHATNRIDKTVVENFGPNGGKRPPTVTYTLGEPPQMRQDVAYIIHTRDGNSELIPVQVGGWVWETVAVCCDLHWEWEARTGWNQRGKPGFESPIGEPVSPPRKQSRKSTRAPGAGVPSF
jgi:hypothetical protein